MDINTIFCNLLGLQGLKITDIKLYNEAKLRAVVKAEVPLMSTRTCQNKKLLTSSYFCACSDL
jgi:hypothetical protein